MHRPLEAPPHRPSEFAEPSFRASCDHMELEPAEWSGVVNRDVQEVRRQLPSPADQKR